VQDALRIWEEAMRKKHNHSNFYFLDVDDYTVGRRLKTPGLQEQSTLLFSMDLVDPATTREKGELILPADSRSLFWWPKADSTSVRTEMFC